MQVFITDLQKRDSFLEKIFDNIYIAKYWCLFLLAWYNDTTYNNTKLLLSFCCNGPSSNSEAPKYLKREPFIEISMTKYSEADRR